MQDTLARALGLKQPLGQARVTVGYLILVYNKDAYMKKFQTQVNNYIYIFFFSSKQLYFYFWHTTFQSKYIG